MPIKRVVTLQPQKTVTFTTQKAELPEGSSLSITDNSQQKGNVKSGILEFVPESMHNDEESSEYQLSDQNYKNLLVEIPQYNLPNSENKISQIDD